MPVGHRNLVAWQKAMDLAVAVYTLNGPRALRHANLANQLMRAVVSVPANIADLSASGTVRRGRKGTVRTHKIGANWLHEPTSDADVRRLGCHLTTT